MKSVIVDVDPGSDDAWALAVLLAGERHNVYKVLAVTCTYGNTSLDNAFRNVTLVLDALQRRDIPVYKGAACSLLGHNDNKVNWHGEDGFGDKFSSSPKFEAQEENAVSAICRLAKLHPDLAVICVGPLTNLALAFRFDRNLSSNLKELWIMGGNTQGIGNVRKTTAEFNFYTDPEAAHVVFNEIKCRVVLLPWEPCIQLPIASEWRKTVLGTVPTKFVELLNGVEDKLYNRFTFWNPCDALLAAAFTDDKVIVKSKDVRLVVETTGTFTRGQGAVVAHEDAPVNARVIQEVDCQLLQRIFLESAQHMK